MDPAGLKLHGHPNREIMDVMARYRKPVLADWRSHFREDTRPWWKRVLPTFGR